MDTNEKLLVFKIYPKKNLSNQNRVTRGCWRSTLSGPASVFSGEHARFLLGISCMKFPQFSFPVGAPRSHCLRCRAAGGQYHLNHEGRKGEKEGRKEGARAEREEERGGKKKKKRPPSGGGNVLAGVPWCGDHRSYRDRQTGEKEGELRPVTLGRSGALNLPTGRYSTRRDATRPGEIRGQEKRNTHLLEGE